MPTPHDLLNLDGDSLDLNVEDVSDVDDATDFQPIHDLDTDAAGPEVSTETRFGAAGSCSYCHGTGVTYWPSSGAAEKCWHCGGSGVGPV
ncbi:MAG: hypothetical protein SFX74_10860 [Fimbriimonadaceae bacterium]|nr:hypothetical protein [Fimbriimonadaceae bacterium]